MRKLIVSSLAAGALALAAPAAHAQVGFGIGGGPTFPTGNLSNAVNAGFHGGVVVDLGIPLLPLGVRGDAMLHHMPGVGNAPNLRQFAATVNGRFSLLPLPLVSAFVIGGPGMYVGGFSGQDTTTDVGFNIGVGARVNLLVIRPFIDARYNRVLRDPGRGFIPVTVGIMF
jgi:hypothetical protein